MIRATLLLLLGLVLAPSSAWSREEPPSTADRLVTLRAPQVLNELARAFDAEDLASFDARVRDPRAPLLDVLNILLNPPGREPSARERAMVARIEQKAPERSGVGPYLLYWSEAGDEARQAERERWGLSARFHAARKSQGLSAAVKLLEPELDALRGARYSRQASNLLSWHVRSRLEVGAFAEAVEALTALRTQAAAEHRPREELRAIELLTHAHQGLGALDEARALFEAGSALATWTGRWERAADLTHGLGSLELTAGNYEAADAHLRRALALAQAAGHEDLERMARVSLSSAARLRGRSDVAQVHARAAMEAGLAAQDVDTAVGAGCSLVIASLDAGRLGDALTYEPWLAANVAKLESPLRRAIAHDLLGELAGLRGDNEEALEHRIAAYRAIQHDGRGQRLVTRFVTGVLLNPTLAQTAREGWVATLERAVAREASVGARGAWVLNDATAAMVQIGRLADARAYALQAKEVADRTADVVARSHGAYALARVAEAEGRWSEAESAFTAAMRDLPGSTPRHIACLEGIGAARGRQGRHEEALPAFREALERRIRQRRGMRHSHALTPRTREHALAAAGMQAALDWASTSPGKQVDAARAAWWFREAGMGRLLAEGLTRPTQAASDAAEVRAAVRDLETHQRKVVVALARGDADAFERSRQALDGAYDRLEALAPVRDRVSTAGTSAATDLDQIQSTLAPTEAIVAYVAARDRMMGLAVTQDRVQLADLGDVASLGALVRNWQILASTPEGPDAKLAARLYERVLGPFRPLLAERRSLTVLPDGALLGVPFDALVIPGPQGGRRLLADHVVRYTHSLDVRHQLRERAARRARGSGLLAVGDPVYPAPTATHADAGVSAPLVARLRGGLQLPSLRGSREEVVGIAGHYPSEVATALLGSDASRARLLEALRARTSPLDVLHLACHGLIDDALPTLSGLVLSGGEVLTAERLRTLSIDADLAVLSACDSGAGRVHAGEGVQGLARALLLAGVSEVVCSTWQVGDASTARLMIRFHEGRTKRGLSTAEALRAARLQALQDPATAHPSYWAGLQVWGAARP